MLRVKVLKKIAIQTLKSHFYLFNMKYKRLNGGCRKNLPDLFKHALNIEEH